MEHIKTITRGTLANAILDEIKEESAWGKTWNGADALTTTFNYCLDLFGRGGALRNADVTDKIELISNAYDEDPTTALRLLFYVRDVRGGYGERDTFTDMMHWVANNHTKSVEQNLWAFVEYGRAKDLYALIGTKAESAMWEWMRNQFFLDKENMENGKSISLLAKWIATPDSKVANTKALGIKTAKKFGYSSKQIAEYKKILRAMRRYLDVPEVKMCAGKWEEIEYSKLGSQCLIKHKKAWKKHDEDRYTTFMTKVDAGEAKINTGAMTPCDIMHQAVHNYSSDLETMWNSLEDVVSGNAIVMCDTSGSMTYTGYGCKSSMLPMEVAVAMSVYLSERNKGDLKDMFMTFSNTPKFIKIPCGSLRDKYSYIKSHSIVEDTNLEAAFDLLLDKCVKCGVSVDDMPDAIVVISDMQINCCTDTESVDDDNVKIPFYNKMKQRYAQYGYKIPHVVFWNVNASNATFHASMNEDGVSLVSGFSANVYKQVMMNLDKTPMDLLNSIVNSKRYEKIQAVD